MSHFAQNIELSNKIYQDLSSRRNRNDKSAICDGAKYKPKISPKVEITFSAVFLLSPRFILTSK
jgi:hypothetical protein